MNLVKQNESIVKDYSSDANGVEKVNSVSYKIMSDATDTATQVGNANASQGGLSINLYGQTGKEIADMEASLTKMIGEL